MWIFPMLMPIIAGGVVYFLYKKGVFEDMCHSKEDSDAEHRDLTPLEILKKRYAQGEITTAEYNKMKEELKEE
ncbi:MAG: SHOCT domain-containing protein [Bacillota bacterium]